MRPTPSPRLLAVAVLVCPWLPAGPAAAQAVTGTPASEGAAQPPGKLQQNTNPEVVPGLEQPAAPQLTGPLSGIGRALNDAGVTLHLDFLDIGFDNLGLGQKSGNTTNGGLFILGADLDLQRIVGIPGGSLHVYEEVATLRSNEVGFAGQVGDNIASYAPFFLPSPNQLSILTYEQKLLDDRLDIEFGRSNPSHAFNLPICENIVSCYNPVLAQDAHVHTPPFGSWMTRVSYNVTPASYVQVGAYEDNPNAFYQHGFDWRSYRSTGAIALAEVGYKTEYGMEAYPQRYELLGFYNSSTQVDPQFTALGRSAVAFPGDPPLLHGGNSGLLLNAQKVVWRADGGRGKTMTPTALSAYGNVSLSFAEAAPVSASGYAGLTLAAPLPARPFDNVGVKVMWSQLSGRYQGFLEASNLAAGGFGYKTPPNTVALEVNAHVQLTRDISFEPSLEYFTQPNNYYAPASPRTARPGYFFGADVFVSFGQLLGLASTP